jgi:hypothetical protein
VSEIKAIETRYKGCRFRSRLEARWAVFFDTLGVEWEYEQQGFTLPKRRKYLPDFWLPGMKHFVEVKGSPKQLDIEKVAAFVTEDVKPRRSLLILGPVKHCADGCVPLHTIAYRPHEHVFFQAFAFLAYSNGTTRPMPIGYPRRHPWADADFIVNTDPQDWIISCSETETAYAAARSARFEHGECG